ncbi:hypothetical protein Phou_016790 [Phytohabitans houttuyneae]|uniref:Uncharacterized protein n=1 Tax=Phytohabitans houttuyneae TaxID=1076126 RepID=A0A6V8K5R7_9ACTN|nr:hypothetical protein Phou_016790 [Phytohabitans houttuyneae]
MHDRDQAGLDQLQPMQELVDLGSGAGSEGAVAGAGRGQRGEPLDGVGGKGVERGVRDGQVAARWEGVEQSGDGGVGVAGVVEEVQDGDE